MDLLYFTPPSPGSSVDRTPPCGGGGQRFKSSPGCHYHRGPSCDGPFFQDHGRRRSHHPLASPARSISLLPALRHFFCVDGLGTAASGAGAGTLPRVSPSAEIEPALGRGQMVRCPQGLWLHHYGRRLRHLCPSPRCDARREVAKRTTGQLSDERRQKWPESDQSASAELFRENIKTPDYQIESCFCDHDRLN